MSKKEKMSPQGTVIGPNGDRLENGKPNLSPTAGYDGHYPVQFADESDVMYASRVAMFEDSLATARQIEAGGETYDFQLDALQARFDADKAVLEENKKLHNLRTDKKTSK